jgi:bifunctional non-homologous end joining protein LigD
MATRKKAVAKKSGAKKAGAKKAGAKKGVAKRSASKPSGARGKLTRQTATRTAKNTARKSPARPRAADQLVEYQRKRNFEKTAEPSGTGSRARSRASARDQLRFVIQKHDASRLHYDLRLEMDGVMKSWAVPKGPSADPAVKRLAMQVEDHPIDYNTFEGTIPAGEYGGGTVMLWDNGTYEIENAVDDDMNAAAHDEYERGEMKVNFHGKRIKGSYALVRTKGMGGSSEKPAWLLIKHRDATARPGSDSELTEKHVKSVTTNRTMDEIADGDRVWHSSR